MRYSRFELLALIVGSVAVIGTVIASFTPVPIVEEILGQLLLLVVLFGAVHWGRNGGFVFATAAVAVYALVRVPAVIQGGLTADVAELVLVRALTYGLVGILGGEVCTHVKYLFAKLEGATNIDEETQVFNERFMRRVLTNSLGQHSRYDTRFSIARITLSPTLLCDLSPAKQRSLLRSVANYARNDVRLVDDVGRLDDGSFLLHMPSTPGEGARIAAERVRAGVRDLLGARDESITVEVMATPEDAAAIRKLVDALKCDTESEQGLEKAV